MVGMHKPKLLLCTQSANCSVKGEGEAKLTTTSDYDMKAQKV
jgi:hypothetical protein